MGLEGCSDQRGTLQAMRLFLSHCTNLEALSVDFDEFPYGSESKFLNALAERPFTSVAFHDWRDLRCRASLHTKTSSSAS
jgi:hypothetical protein